MGLYDYTIYNVIKRNAMIFGRRIGWICGDERLTHKEFLSRVNRLAKGLLDLGLKKGDRIGVIAQNSLEFAYLYGASAKIGAIMLPINWRLQSGEVEYCLSDGSPGVVFVGAEFQTMVNPLLKKLDFIKETYSMGQAQGAFGPLAELMENDGFGPEPETRFDDDFVIIHTAAAAVRPRGATIAHRELLISNLQALATWNMGPETCNLNMLPLYHLAGLSTMLNVMQAGGENILVSGFEADRACTLIEAEKVNILYEFAPMLSKILESNEALKCDLSSLKVVVGLESPETVKRFEKEIGGTFWTAFGQSETSGLVTFTPYHERPGSAGVPTFMTEVAVMNEKGDVVGPGKPGEITVRGPMVFKGYWNLPEETEYTFRGGWHHTGDMGRLDEEGYLWFLGRLPEKELIKTGGENVYPAEVEEALLANPLVKEACVIGVPDEKWGEAIKAVCVLIPGAVLKEEALIEFVALKIARFKKPKQVVYVSDLPRKEDGTMDRAQIKNQYGKS